MAVYSPANFSGGWAHSRKASGLSAQVGCSGSALVLSVPTTSPGTEGSRAGYSTETWDSCSDSLSGASSRDEDLEAPGGSIGILPGSYEGEDARAHLPDLRAGVLSIPPLEV